jgi:hypothetical protein
MKSTKTGFKLLALSVTMVAMVGSVQAGEDYGVTVD